MRSRPVYRLLKLLPAELTTINTLATVRVATVSQIAQCESDKPSWKADMRVVRKRVERLRRFGLLRRVTNTAQERTAGPAGYIYALTAAGLRRAGNYDSTRQRRAWRPKPLTLDHWLAITDLYVRLMAKARSGGPAVREFRVEADARRTYRGAFDQRRSLRPDALVRLATADLLMSYFIEIDRSTESPRRLAEKCQAYRAYELAGDEQEHHGVFPLVVFIVPDEHRAEAVARVIEAQPADARELFLVATQAEAIHVLTNPSFDSLISQPERKDIS